MVRRNLILLVMVVLVIGPATEAKNRFNVFSYSDSPWTANKLQFYTWFKEFRLSGFQTYDPLWAGTYLRDSLGDTVALYTQHWRKPPGYDEIIYISDDSTVDLYNSAVDCHNGRMHVLNTEVVKGYHNASSVGSSYTDYPRSVLRARVGIDAPGLLHDRFDKGIFEVSHTALNTEATYSALMRLPDITGDSNTVVAQLIAEDRRQNEYGWVDCKQNTTNPYAATQYNDSWLIVGTASGLDTVLAINPSATSSIQVAVHGCQTDPNNEDDFVTFDAGTVPSNICYEVNNGGTLDTICTLPFRFVKDVRIADFPTNNNYYEVSTKAAIGGGWRRFAWKVYWTDQKTLYLDSLFVYNDKGITYDTLVKEHMSEITSNIQDWYDNHPLVKGRIKGIYSQDEVKGMDMQMVERVRLITDNLAELGPDYPGDFLATLGAYNGPYESSWDGQYYDSYLHYANRDHFMFDFYQFYCYITSSSDEPDETKNIQTLMDWYINQMSIARARATATSSDYTIILPVFDHWSETSGGTYLKDIRKPTPREVWALVNLALGHGARGVGYWKFTGAGLPDSISTARTRSDSYYALSGEIIEDFTEIDEEMIDAGCSTSPTEPYEGFGALIVEPPNHVTYKTNLFDSIVVVNTYLDSMAGFFNSATWQSAGPWDTTLYSMTGSIIDSIKTLAEYDSAFVQVGFFEKDTSDYAYVINRRVMNDPPDVDSQTVRLFLKGGAGLYEVREVYANTCDTVFDSAGFVIYDLFLDPGEAKLVRRNKIKGINWQGTLAQDWTWTPGATIKLVGDVTVSSGKTLTIQSNRVDILPFMDSARAGADTTKVEIRVSGLLSLEGSASNRIELGPDTAVNDGWLGIKVLSTGRARVDNALIKNAYCGLHLNNENHDTIKNTRFQDCSWINLYLESDSAYIYQDTFSLTRPMANGYGIYAAWVDGVAEITNCFFENIRHPIRHYASDVPVTDCYFVEYDYHASGSGGYPAIAAGYNSDPTISGCVFNNSVKGIYVESNCDVVVNNCEFKSDSTYDTHPFMYMALHGTPSTSSCEVRNSCFKPCQDRHVLTESTTFDLGSVPDSGLNTFHVQRIVHDEVHCIYYYRPQSAVYNNSGSSVEAEVNWWDADAHPSWIYGTVDTTPVRTSAGCYFYTTECGGGAKISADELADSAFLPSHFAVRQNYPNPFNPVTVIGFALPARQSVKLEVFNVLGQRIVALVDREMEPGDYSIEWDGRDESGSPVATGVYLYRLAAGDFVETKKMLLLK